MNNLQTAATGTVDKATIGRFIDRIQTALTAIDVALWDAPSAPPRDVLPMAQDALLKLGDELKQLRQA